ncbi:MAG: regulatory iron-sulfur-containing complex subunit RicT, partial [Planctomycetota bacterium]|nr:regulatory iron-sulfur-containing complex subunit RicT [Planctomycetota bacterium]
TKQAKNKKYMLVRYGRMNALGLFEHHESTISKVHKRVVIKTNRGIELGHLVGRLSSYKGGQFRLSGEQMMEYFDDGDTDFSRGPKGKFVRFATAADISEEWHLRKIVKEEMECCQRFIDEMKLPMKIVDAEHVFGGERIIYYFMSDGRVDFRDLVKKVAQEYQTRIEMRQIGSRDEAKLLGDVESCGQQCCCQRFLKHLKPVNMRMAKMQKATLDPAKISGYCGRLKCCLRYEDKTYTDLKKRLPKRNTRVKTEQGRGRVVNTQILTQLVMVEYENGERKAVDVDEIEIIPQSAPDRKQDVAPKNKDKGRKEKERKEKKRQPE